MFRHAQLLRLELNAAKRFTGSPLIYSDTNECFRVSTDIGDHWPDTCLGGVQGDCSSALGRGIMGVPEQPLQQRSNDAGGRPPLRHHHCHDTSTQVFKCASVFPFSFILCASDHVFVFAGQQDCSHEAL